jgi:hypothetical protein
MTYWDTSYLAKLNLREPGTKRCWRLFPPKATWPVASMAGWS